MSRSVIAALTLVIVAPAMAETTAPPAPSPQPVAAVAPAKPKLICKTYAETGSLIARKKVCRTRAEMRQESEDIQNLNNERICSGPACNGVPG